MKPLHIRILYIFGVLLILLVFVFPLWKITLIAPQYPDGVVMHIYINKIGGDSPSTLQNINILNHYIGMKYIEPESIPELKYFPWIMIGMTVLGVVAGVFGNKWVFLAWTIVLIILCALGVYDFYLWEYDYGHNLDPKAPIKIPGMVYQPPLIGNKYLLNFLAKSWPAGGAIGVGLSILITLAAGILKKRPS